MESAQRYAGYSMDDLRDVERRIDRAKFPQTYAALMLEIERRQGSRSHEPIKPEPFWKSQARCQCRSLMLAVCVGCIARAVLGNWLGDHALSAPDAFHTQRMELGSSFFLYVTPAQEMLSRFLDLFLWPALPGVIVLAAVVGLRSPVDSHSSEPEILSSERRDG